MKPEDVQKYDQASAFIAEAMPPFWRQLFDGCVKEGFSEDQALQLVKAHLFASAGGKLER